MNAVGKVFWAPVMLFLSLGAIASDLTVRDLEGFKYARTVLFYKDIKLPKPVPPEKGGIETGAVFILGRYLPPPYEVTVEGVHVMINGVPCTSLMRLLETEEDRKQNLIREIINPVEFNLRNTYQKTKMNEGKEMADKKLREAIEKLDGFEFIGIERSMDENAITGIISHLWHSTINLKYDGRVPFKPNDNPEDAIKRYEADDHGDVKILGYDYIYGPYKQIIVHLSHPKIGSFDIEVESNKVEEWWTKTCGTKILQEKMFEIQSKYGCGEKENTRKEIREYALSLPWVKSFEFPVADISVFKLNGVDCQFSDGYHPENDESLPSIAEYEERIHNDAVEHRAPDIIKDLENDCALFFDHSYTVCRKNPELVPGIKSVMKNKTSSFPEAKSRLTDLFEKLKINISYECAVEFLSVYYEDLGELQ